MSRGPGVALAGVGALQPPSWLRLELSSSGSLQKPSPVTAISQRLALFKGPVAPSISRQGLWLAGRGGPLCSQASPELGGEGQQMFNDRELCAPVLGGSGQHRAQIPPHPPPSPQPSPHLQPQKVAQRTLLLVLDSSPQAWRELSVVREY